MFGGQGLVDGARGGLGFAVDEEGAFEGELGFEVF